MCGFVGCIYHQPQEIELDIHNLITDMNSMITHRGPDDEGYYFDDHINFAFRRLSIIDLESGHQPLSYENERYWIVFNGEIYNFLELKNEWLNKGYEFKTNSDTEVILALYSELKEKSVNKLRGMFAFLIWDKEEQQLFGARDHFGIKPFYYTEREELTFFASEKKSIQHAVNSTIHLDALHHYLSFQYIPEPDTMSTEIKKLPPGHYFTLKPGGKLNIQRYWSAHFQPIYHAESELIKKVRDSLIDSVHVHMRSDVPIGAFLSGGIDSSFIASIAKEINPHLKTFSVGFQREGFSEIDVAQQTASALHLDNFSYIISPEEFINELPKIVYYMDDPLADPAAVPLYFVAREASKQVKVVLSGEGADELFGGYNIYREPQSLRVFNYLPDPMKGLLKQVSRLLPEGLKGKSFIERGVTPLENRYIGNAKIFEEKEKKPLLTFQTNVDYTKITEPFYNQTSRYDPVTTMQYLDIHTWLKGDILVKADRMTMAHSLELRVPFLDKEVFKVASCIPSQQKIKENTTKYILRKAAEGIVPNHVIGRKKLGFPVPIRHWLKNEIYDWALQLIITSPTDYLFNKSVIHHLLEEHVMNKKDNSRKLWTILVFMIWHKIYIEGAYDFTYLDEKPSEKREALLV